MVCFLDQDWLDFDTALHKVFPQARFFRKIERAAWRPQGMVPPKVKLCRRLMEAEPDPTDLVYMVFDPDWEPEFHRYTNPYRDSPQKWWWSMKGTPLPFAFWRGLDGRLFQDGTIEYPNKSEIHFYTTPGNKEHAAIAGKFYRLFAKHATNRMGLVWVSMPDLEVTHPVQKGAMEWCGHHAIEWARQAPNRVLFYSHNLSIRPTAEVKPFAPPAEPIARKKA
jgi:hypothetical protein